MKTNRILSIVNLVGCIAISVILLVQWGRELILDEHIRTLAREADTAREEVEAGKKREAGLESDVAQLKESLEDMVRSKREAEEAMARFTAEQEAAAAQAATSGQILRDQSAAWQQAIAERDQKIKELNTALVATRQRLDEAVQKLKAAGAR